MRSAVRLLAIAGLFTGLVFSGARASEISPAPAPAYSWFDSRLEIDHSCREVEELHELLSTYFTDIQNGRSVERLRSDLGALKRRVGEIAGHDSVCRQAALSSYLLESTYHLTAGLQDRASITDRRGPFSLGWTYALLAALNQGHIEFTNGVRAIRTGSDRRDHDILGAYDCAGARIQLDPLISPLDLGATAVHELNHLMADRWGAGSFSEYSGFDGAEAARLRAIRAEITPDRILMEEAASALLAGYLEQSFTASRVPVALREASWGDITMFSRTGVLARSLPRVVLLDYERSLPVDWDVEREKARQSDSQPVARDWEFQTTDPEVMRRGRTIMLDYPAKVLAETLLTGNTHRISELARSEADLFMQKLLSTISLPYFGMNVSTDAVRRLQERQAGTFRGGPSAGKDMIPWGALPLARSTYGSLLQWWTFAPDALLSHAASSRVRLFESAGVYSGFYENDQPWSLSRLDARLSRKQPIPSPVCREFINLANRHRLGGYLGQPTAPVRPGVDGVRPGVDGVRPGVDGVRPGVDGIRPGVDGVRPSTDAVRPCVPIGSDL